IGHAPAGASAGPAAAKEDRRPKGGHSRHSAATGLSKSPRPSASGVTERERRSGSLNALSGLLHGLPADRVVRKAMRRDLVGIVEIAAVEDDGRAHATLHL